MSPSIDDILNIARKAIDIFAKRRLDCCLFGSTASYLYGVPRSPNDVDIVILTDAYTQEMLKEMLVRANPRFYLVRSRSPTASYRVLWYRLSSSFHPRPSVDCKVDVVIPGILNIPNVPPSRIVTLRGLPVMPLVPQLMLKLQGWADHRASDRPDMLAKGPVDVRDIDGLLEIAVGKRERVTAEDLAEWLPESMVRTAAGRLELYTMLGSSRSAGRWRELGFAI